MEAPDFLTRQLLLGMNLVSWAGFVLMGLAYQLTRTRRARMPYGFALMGVGTALVFLGLHLAPPAPTP
jgi:NADH:ubiquinone oxidoreductase subunit 2 (subunit N)